MAWTAPRTWVTSEVVSATIMNAHVRDNLLETAPAKASAKGDLFAATTANAISRVAVGSNGQVIMANSACNTGVQWTGILTLSGAANGGATVTASKGTFGLADAVYSGASNINLSIRSACGFGSYLSFSEAGVSDKWLIGTNTADTALYFGVGATTASSYRFLINNAGNHIINTESVNAGLDMRSGTLSHGMTSQAHTSTYFDIQNQSAGNGGVYLNAYTTNQVGVWVNANVTSTETAKSSAAMSAIVLEANLKSGTGTTAMSANTNLLTINNFSTTRFIFDADGDLHADAAVSASAYDLWDDAHLARALMTEIGGKHIVKNEFDGFLKYNRQHLQDLGVATFNDGAEGDGSVFVNWMQMSRVLAGAAWQLSSCIMRLERDVESRLADLTGRLDGMTRVLSSGSGLQEWGSAT